MTQLLNNQPHQQLKALNFEESEVWPKQCVDFWNDIKLGENLLS